MIDKFKIGDEKTFIRTVRREDLAEFEAGMVHPFYATFALGRDAEWTGRLFVLDILEEHEEGIGSFLTVQHKSPALLGQQVEFTARICELNGTKISCTFEAKVGSRLIATGTVGQRVLTKNQVNQIKEKATNG
ncbi:MAG: hypothetical protein JJ975_09940 [Bacteroidia bacterium]|nr:hypothetical protein [Bacteroidia bacterium]